MSLRERVLALVTLALAALIATVSLAGLLVPDLYVRETPSWAAQTIGQDWFDLVVLVPVLVACAIGLLRGSRRALIVLGGALVFTIYTFLLYGFAVHFNRMFLVYCATLGTASFALAVLAARLHDAPITRWLAVDPPMRTLGAVLTGCAVAFLFLWLAEDVPAILRDTPPASHAEVGLPTNPVHVIDLSLMLPAMLIAGVAAIQRRRLGYLLGPILLAFSALMAGSIATLMLVMRARGLPAPAPVMSTMVVLAVASAVLLARVLARKAQHEAGAAPRRGLQRDLAAVPPHGREHVREAEARA